MDQNDVWMTTFDLGGHIGLKVSFMDYWQTSSACCISFSIFTSICFLLLMSLLSSLDSNVTLCSFSCWHTHTHTYACIQYTHRFHKLELSSRWLHIYRKLHRENPLVLPHTFLMCYLVWTEDMLHFQIVDLKFIQVFVHSLLTVLLENFLKT